MAFELAIICVLAGAVLGARYNVLVLVPAVTLAVVFAVIIGIARAYSFWSIVMATTMVAVAVQLGYLAGVATYAAIEAIRAARARDASLNFSRSRGRDTLSLMARLTQSDR